MKRKPAVKVTEAYYDSNDADHFYQEVWGGEYLHVGIYADEKMEIHEASENTVKRMVRLLPKIKKSTKILDLGSGYGGTARYLAEKFGCKITCLNLSEVQNEVNHARNKAAGLEEKITVTKGNFEKLPFPRESFDIIWSQDAFLHSAHKDKVFIEVSRVLNPEGRFIFTDIIKKEDCPEDALQPVLERLQLKDLATIKKYDRMARRVDLEKVYTKEMPDMLLMHYQEVLDRLKKDRSALAKKISKTYLDEMAKGLQHWIDAAEAGYISWGIIQYQKKNTWM